MELIKFFFNPNWVNFHDWVMTFAFYDRALAKQAQQNEQTANTTAGQAANNAGQERASLMPSLKAEVNNPTGLTANTQHELLTTAEAGAGGATSGLTGQVGLNANRTRNAGSTSNLMDTLARSKAQAAGKASEGIASESAMLGQKNKQAALGQMQNMYGTDTGANLKAMGIANEDVDTELKAKQQGWLQDTEEIGKQAGEAAMIA
jgi:hypothetical protein